MELARAKINLALHVTGVTENGYHVLDSLVAFADIGDELFIERADTPSLTLEGPFAATLDAGPENLVLRAAEMMSAPYVTIRLVKNLPVASGIGGGSADAAATIRGLCKLFDLSQPSGDAVARLGADVPVCLFNQACRMAGIGDVITPLALAQPWHAVLVNPGVAVSTEEVFAALDEKSNFPMPAEMDLSIDGLGNMRNDLEAPALRIFPDIERVLNALTSAGAGLSRMSGSGATCFGLFSNGEQAAHAATEISAKNPNWWVQPTILS